MYKFCLKLYIQINFQLKHNSKKYNKMINNSKVSDKKQEEILNKSDENDVEKVSIVKSLKHLPENQITEAQSLSLGEERFKNKTTL